MRLHARVKNTYIHTYIYIYTQKNIHIYIYIFIYLYIYIRVQRNLYIYIGRVSFTRACSYSHLYISRFKVYMTRRNVYRQSI